MNSLVEAALRDRPLTRPGRSGDLLASTREEGAGTFALRTGFQMYADLLT